MRKFALLSLYVFLVSLAASSRNRALATIPFEIVGSYAVVQMRVNASSKLSFIIDTGVRNTIITELLPGDSILLDYKSTRSLQGLGKGSVLNAFVSHGNTFHLNRKFSLTNKMVYVLEDDIFNLSRQTGHKINGILGSDFFQDYTVEIDYSRRKLCFYDRERFSPPNGYGVMPMTMDGQKMYIHLSVLETDENRRSIKMLIDTGAELTAWFQTLTNNAVSIPEKSIRGRIGEGLSGEVSGIFARVPQICIANFCVKNPIVAFPDSVAIAEIIQNTDRDGTIGSQLLSRFNLIIDTYNKRFFFKPNGLFNKPFSYNIAGIEVAQAIAFVPQIEVIHVWKDSPADQAGIQAGDVITEINFEKVYGLTLTHLRSFFEKSSRTPLKITVQRNNETLEFSLDMRAKI